MVFKSHDDYQDLGRTWYWVSDQVENGSWFVVNVEAQRVVPFRKLNQEMRISIHCRGQQSLKIPVMNKKDSLQLC